MSETPEKPSPQISRDEMRERVEYAIRIERFLMRLGWLVLALATVGLVGSVLLWVLEQISTEQALGAIFGVLISSILSGAAAYGSGINIGLGASRLVIAMGDDDS